MHSLCRWKWKRNSSVEFQSGFIRSFVRLRSSVVVSNYKFYDATENFCVLNDGLTATQMKWNENECRAWYFCGKAIANGWNPSIDIDAVVLMNFWISFLKKISAFFVHFAFTLLFVSISLFARLTFSSIFLSFLSSFFFVGFPVSRWSLLFDRLGCSRCLFLDSSRSFLNVLFHLIRTHICINLEWISFNVNMGIMFWDIISIM